MATKTQAEIIADLERANADKQERINRAVRDLDYVAYRLSGAPPDLYKFVLEAQTRLRGR